VIRSQQPNKAYYNGWDRIFNKQKKEGKMEVTLETINVLEDLIARKEMFSCYDITKKLRDKGYITVHAKTRELIHGLHAQESIIFATYQRHTHTFMDYMGPVTAEVYADILANVNDYEPNKKSKPQGNAGTVKLVQKYPLGSKWEVISDGLKGYTYILKIFTSGDRGGSNSRIGKVGLTNPMNLPGAFSAGWLTFPITVIDANNISEAEWEKICGGDKLERIDVPNAPIAPVTMGNRPTRDKRGRLCVPNSYIRGMKLKAGNTVYIHKTINGLELSSDTTPNDKYLTTLKVDKDNNVRISKKILKRADVLSSTQNSLITSDNSKVLISK